MNSTNSSESGARKNPWFPVLVWGGVGVAFTILHCLIKLLGVPGYEAAQAQTIFFAIASGFLTVSFIKRRSGESGDIPRGASISFSALFSMLAVNTGVIGAFGLAYGACQWAMSLLWFAVLPLPTIILGVAAGTLAAVSIRKTWLAHLAYLAFALFMLAWELAAVWKLPVTFAYNMLLGYFPGPVYDRAVRVSAALLSSRFEAVCLAAALLCLAAMQARIRRAEGKARLLHLALIMILSMSAFVVVSAFGQSLGTSVSRKLIDKELGGKLVGKNVILHYPEDLTKDTTRLLLLDAEFRFAQQSRFLGLTNPPPVSAYFYRNADEKKFLMGAAGTQYADCANREMHMNIQHPPHSVLKHEIVHVLAAPWGIKGLGFSPILGVTEGLAVASEVWRDDYPIPMWAAAMKKIGRLPKMSKNSGMTGFWKISGSRSYLAWGGFVAWLIDNYSMDAVRRVYLSGDWKKAFGEDVDQLEKRWRKDLDAVEVPAKLMKIATDKFYRKSLFEMRCARAVGTMTEDAWNAFDKGRVKKAGRLFENTYAFSGGNPRLGRYLIEACYESRDYECAENLAKKIVETEGKALLDPTAAQEKIGNQRVAVQALAAQARMAWIRQDLKKARELYALVRRADIYSSLNREAAVALEALDDPALEEPMRKYFVDPDAHGSGDYQLMKALDLRPENGALHYMLGRRLYLKNQFDDAAKELVTALELGMPDPAVAHEAWRLAGINYFEAAKYALAARAFQTGRPPDLTPGEILEADEWIERCRFAESFALPKELQ